MEKRKWGRIRVSQPLKLRSARDPNHSYNAVAIDVSEENIGIETEAKLELGELIQLELEAQGRTIVVQSIITRTYDNGYGCKFVEDDYGKLFSYLVNKIGNAIEELKLQGKHLLLLCRKILFPPATLPVD